MKRHATLAAFLVTVAVVVPAAWHAVDADLDRDGKHLRPLQKTLELDGGVKVTLDVDRSVVMTGDTVTATVRGFADKKQTVAIDIRALHSTNYEGERVSKPWFQIDRETVQVVAEPGGGKPVTTQIALGKRPSTAGLTDMFQVMITEHGTKIPTNRFDGGEKTRDFDSIEEGKAAAISLEGWSGNNLGIAIARDGKGKIVDGTPFTIAVRVKNTTGGKLAHHPWVNLTTEEALEARDDPEGEAPITIERQDQDGDDDYDKKWKAGAEYTAKFVVTPHLKGIKHVTLLAHASLGEGLGPAGPGAMDARTFDVAAPKPESKEVAAK